MNTGEDERVPMQFLVISAFQNPDTEHDETYGGAHVSCWVKDQTARNATLIARGLIEENGWIVDTIEEHYPITEEDYSNTSESLQYFEQAQTDGEVFVFHVFPQNQKSAHLLSPGRDDGT